MPDLFGFKALKAEVDGHHDEFSAEVQLLTKSVREVGDQLKKAMKQLDEFNDRLEELNSFQIRIMEQNRLRAKSAFRKIGLSIGIAHLDQLYFKAWLEYTRVSRDGRDQQKTLQALQDDFNAKLEFINQAVSEHSVDLGNQAKAQTDLNSLTTALRSDFTTEIHRLEEITKPVKHILNLNADSENLRTRVRSLENTVALYRSDPKSTGYSTRIIKWTIKNISQNLEKGYLSYDTNSFMVSGFSGWSLHLSLVSHAGLPGSCQLTMSGPLEVNGSIKMSSRTAEHELIRTVEPRNAVWKSPSLFFSDIFDKKTDTLDFRIKVASLTHVEDLQGDGQDPNQILKAHTEVVPLSVKDLREAVRLEVQSYKDRRTRRVRWRIKDISNYLCPTVQLHSDKVSIAGISGILISLIPLDTDETCTVKVRISKSHPSPEYFTVEIADRKRRFELTDLVDEDGDWFYFERQKFVKIPSNTNTLDVILELPECEDESLIETGNVQRLGGSPRFVPTLSPRIDLRQEQEIN